MLEYNLIVSGKPNFISEDCIKNWDEISYSMKRNGFSGIVRSFSSQFEFTNMAYTALVDEYISKGLQSDAQIEIYEKDRLGNKKLIFSSHLDFGSFEYSDSVAYINASDTTLASKIKAKKSTKFEYPVSEIKERNNLLYDRIKMNNRIEWIFSGQNKEIGGQNTYYNACLIQTLIPVYIKSSEIYVKASSEVYDVYKKGSDVGSVMIKNVYGSNLYLNIKSNLKFHLDTQRDGGIVIREIYVKFGLYDVNTEGEMTLLKSMELREGVAMSGVFELDFITSLLPGHSLALIATGTGFFYMYEKDASEQSFVIEYVLKERSEYIDVVKPVTLLNKILYSINGNKNGFIGEIESTDPRINNTLLVPAESIRGLQGAKVYTSLNDFINWMESVFGYVPYIDLDKLIFRKRDSLYNTKIQKEITNLGEESHVKIESKNIYSTVKIGYEKQDYDNINGRDEYHFGVEYDTGISITNNRLELISPYRADVYGFEFLTLKRGEETTDSESDKDIFFIGAELKDDVYRLIRSGYTTSGIKDDMFNIMFSPKFCVEANKSFIASFTDKLIFASSEGNVNITINGKAENSNETFSKDDALFTISTMSFETADGSIPADIHGIVEVKRNGFLYRCYVNEAKYKLGLYKGISYELQIKSITRL